MCAVFKATPSELHINPTETGVVQHEGDRGGARWMTQGTIHCGSQCLFLLLVSIVPIKILRHLGLQLPFSMWQYLPRVTTKFLCV